MFQSQIAAISQRSQRFQGFGNFAPVSPTSEGFVIDVADLQRALNIKPSSLPKLVVDGIIGPKTRARIAEFKSSIGYSNDSVIDAALVAALGVSLKKGVAGVAWNDPTLDPNYVSGGDPSQIPTTYPSPKDNTGASPKPPKPTTDYTKYIIYGALALGVLTFLKRAREG